MEEIVSQAKNQKLVKVLSWILICLSVIVLLRTIFVLQGYASMITMQSITKKFNPPVEINFTLYFIQAAIEIILCVIVFISAVYVLKYKSLWRQVLVYGLVASIVFLVVTPLISYNNLPALKIKMAGINDREMLSVAKTTILIWSYTWSIIFSAFFVFVILKLSKPEIKLLFK